MYANWLRSEDIDTRDSHRGKKMSHSKSRITKLTSFFILSVKSDHCQLPSGTYVTNSEVYGQYETIVKQIVNAPLSINDTLCLKLNKNPNSKALRVVLKNLEFRHEIKSSYQFVQPSFQISCQQQCEPKCDCTGVFVKMSRKWPKVT